MEDMSVLTFKQLAVGIGLVFGIAVGTAILIFLYIEWRKG